MQYITKTLGRSHSSKAIQSWNHKPLGPEALTFVNDLTTKLYTGEIRAVEIDYMVFFSCTI